jgi:hypothetical protein
MTFAYQKLVHDHPLTFHEGSRTYQLLFKERHLQVLWLEQSYFKHLKTRTGQALEVISPGIWNAESGPDFLKAHIRIGAQEFKGDIELHLSEEGWEQHGHHMDPRYQQVILHLALWTPKHPKVLRKADGSELVCGYLEDALTMPLGKLVQLIDLDLYPYRKFVGSGRCAHAVFEQMPTAQMHALFTSAAVWRLEQKQRFLQARCLDLNEQLLAGFAMALGYKANAQAFLEIFLGLRSQQKMSRDACFAWVLGTAGFFSARYVEKWEGSTRYDSLRREWESGNPQSSQRVSIVVDKQRPFNHPVRRLAALAWLTQDDTQKGLFEACHQQWKNTWELCQRTQRWRPLMRSLLERLPAYEDAYWGSHYLFEQTGKGAQLPLVGSDLKQKVILNAFLPLLYTQILGGQIDGERQAFLAFYRSLAASESGKLRYLTHRFFGDAPKGQWLKFALFEQGVFQVHRDFCMHYEASCEGCPFVDRVKQEFLKA